MMMPDDPLLSDVEAAEYLGLSVFTLRDWRLAGIGLDYIRVGSRKGASIRYRRSTLEAYLEENTVKVAKLEAVKSPAIDGVPTRRSKKKKIAA